MSSAEDTGKKRSWLDNPITTMVIGFVLTGVLGTALTQYFMDRRDQENIRSEAVITRKEAVKQLSHLMAARQIQAKLFVEAIITGASDEEIRKLKLEHREAYKAWQTERGSTMLLVREIMSEEAYRDFTQYVEVRLVDNIFEPLRECILELYSKSKERQAAVTAVEQCRVNELIEKLENCSNAIVDGLYVLASARTSNSDDADTQRARNARARIEKSCP